MIVIDANVVVKWFVDEAGTAEALSYLESGQSLIAPAHILAEVGEALVRYVRHGELQREQLVLAAVALSDVFQLMPLNELFEIATRIALDAQISHYDALYVAAAEHCRAPLVTGDRVLLRKLAGTEWADRVRPLVPLN